MCFYLVGFVVGWFLVWGFFCLLVCLIFVGLFFFFNIIQASLVAGRYLLMKLQ